MPTTIAGNNQYQNSNGSPRLDCNKSISELPIPGIEKGSIRNKSLVGIRPVPDPILLAISKNIIHAPPKNAISQVTTVNIFHFRDITMMPNI